MKRICNNCYMIEMKGECHKTGALKNSIVNGYCQYHQFYDEFIEKKNSKLQEPELLPNGLITAVSC